ncbi:MULTISPECIES: FAD-binding oxidoreductase [unclassified Isoptericola]|uniref:FAD-binding oxidoreductase n=1 Tax=unclassified Isoptericola TaxID=2623355 RepID=UPI0027143F9B|nr:MULTISPECIES: FAD-binding oxidoreductase [unclassified Isoptericola]MDO8145897.1 FAD-binding oxidoreductase [Isoptericola sp. 178]MDO8147748.1 FAD-binding oxidoreductase [Isoptericola sp. b515]
MSEPSPGVGPVVLRGGRPVRTPAGGAPGEQLTDFGRQVFGRPAVVYQPRSPRSLREAVAEAAADGRVVVPRGRGHSVDGQTVLDDSALVDLSGLRRVREVTDDAVTVDAGATWRDVLRATLPRRRAPAVVPDYLDLTVGGTLSMGGINGASHRCGTTADHVRRGTVVSDDGAAQEVPGGGAVLDRVLTGQGRHGILATATLSLRPVPRRVRRSDVVTRTLQDHIDVQRNLLDTGTVHWLEGFATPGRDGAPTFTSRLAQPDDHGSTLVMDRTRGRSDLLDFFARADRVVASERARGRWQHNPHPRMQMILPLGPGREVVDELLGRGAGHLLGPGGTLMVTVTIAAALRRLAVHGDDSGHALVVGWQRTAPRGDGPALRRMQAENRHLAALVVEAGGVLYGAGPALDPSEPCGVLRRRGR